MIACSHHLKYSIYGLREEWSGPRHARNPTVGVWWKRAMELFHFFSRFLFENKTGDLTAPYPRPWSAVMLFFNRSREIATFIPSLPEAGTTLHLVISSPSRYISWYGSILKIVKWKDCGLDASCRVYREPYNLYREEPTEILGFCFLYSLLAARIL